MNEEQVKVGSRMYCTSGWSDHRGEPCTLVKILDDSCGDALEWEVRVRFDNGDEETVHAYELYERMVHARVTVDLVFADEYEYEDWLHELKRMEHSFDPVSVEVKEEMREQTAPASER